MDVATGLCRQVPGFAEAPEADPAWRVSGTGRPPKASRWSRRWSGGATPRTRVMSAGARRWSLATGSATPGPDYPESSSHLHASGASGLGKPIPPRGFRRVAYVGLDMIIGQGGHAEGAGLHRSGFSFDSRRLPARLRRLASFRQRRSRGRNPGRQPDPGDGPARTPSPRSAGRLAANRLTGPGYSGRILVLSVRKPPYNGDWRSPQGWRGARFDDR